jgi:hypothetical protein
MRKLLSERQWFERQLSKQPPLHMRRQFVSTK